MQYYLAPLEGITGYIYRNAYHEYFEPADKYFTPFLVPNQNRRFKTGEINDVLPENNKGLFIIPQLLTSNAGDFLWAAEELYQFGYREINLNLGCPARTVVTKGKGSGFLADPYRLDKFLDQIYAGTKTDISIKTRIGKDDPEEFFDLLNIFNKYPVKELIIHPRVQTDFYKNKPNIETFGYAAGTSSSPVVYNGDILTPDRLAALQQQFPEMETVMIGRGLLRNPGLIGECKGQAQNSKETLKAFHDRIYEDYQGFLSGERNVLFRMKELWFYMISLFTNPDKYMKKIKKAEKQLLYDEIIQKLFDEQDIISG